MAEEKFVEIDPKSIKALREVQAEIAKRADGKALTRKLNKKLSAAAKRIQAEQRRNAGDLDFESSSSGSSGTSRFNRTQRTAGVTAKGKKRQGRGLRAEIAATIRVKISKDNKGGSGSGVRIVQSSGDKDVNKIAKRLNRKGFVRHPLFGDKEHWYNTKAANGTDWFWQPFADQRDNVRREIGEALDEFARDLARDIDRKS